MLCGPETTVESERSATKEGELHKPKRTGECMTTIHGKKYDLAEFVNRHPGGKTAIMLAHGHDSTKLFESYHALTNKAHVVLDKYALEPAGAEGSVSLQQHMGDAFYRTVSARVREYFEGKRLHTKATPQRLAFYAALVASYTVLLIGYLAGSWPALGPYILVAWLVAGIGHDGAHFQLGRSQLLNELGGVCIGTICNPWRWYWQHTVGHHVHTNEPDHDPDLYHWFPHLRIHPNFPNTDGAFRQQRMWAAVLLPFSTFGITVLGPLRHGAKWVFRPAIAGNRDALPAQGVTQITVDRFSQLKQALLWHEAHFVWFWIVHLLLPLLLMPVPKALFFWVAYVFGTGGLFGVASQINHLTENTIKAGLAGTSETDAHQKKSWAARQCETSNNFGMDSYGTFVLFNGLNFQIEHHLFPGVNHEHLHAIAPIVERTCKEYGVGYQKFPYASDAFRAFLDWLLVMGQSDDENNTKKQR